MEQQGLTRKDLDGLIGSRSRIAEVLNGRRGLSIGMIRRLHEHLGISADVLIRPVRRGETHDATREARRGRAAGRTARFQPEKTED